MDAYSSWFYDSSCRLELVLRHAARFTGGVLLVLVGIVGLILPIMPGWVFVIPGLIILGEYIPPIKRLLDWLYSKVPDSIAWKKKPGGSDNS